MKLGQRIPNFECNSNQKKKVKIVLSIKNVKYRKLHLNLADQIHSSLRPINSCKMFKSRIFVSLELIYRIDHKLA